MTCRVETISKSDAGLRQIRQAIRIFFARGDMIAVHTLTGAAFQVFTDLGKLKGIKSRYRGEDIVRPDRVADLERALNHTQNFLKHADKDPDATLSYVEEASVLYLFEAVELSYQVLRQDSRELLAFRIWFIVTHPDLVVPELLSKITSLIPDGLDQSDKDLWTRWLDSPSV